MSLVKLNIARGVTGTLPTSNYVGGKVLQIVSTGNIGGNTASTSTSYATTGAIQSITPSTTSSKIFVLFAVPTNTNNNNTSCKIKVYRQVASGGYSAISNIYNTVYTSSGNTSQFCNIQWYDTPTYSAGNQIDYKLYLASSDGGSVNVYNEGGNQNQLTLMEIAG